MAPVRAVGRLLDTFDKEMARSVAVCITAGTEQRQRARRGRAEASYSQVAQKGYGDRGGAATYLIAPRPRSEPPTIHYGHSALIRNTRRVPAFLAGRKVQSVSSYRRTRPIA